jgi:hypothetical protein
MRRREQPLAEAVLAAVREAVGVLQHFARDRLHDVATLLARSQLGPHAQPDEAAQRRQVARDEVFDFVVAGLGHRLGTPGMRAIVSPPVPSVQP